MWYHLPVPKRKGDYFFMKIFQQREETKAGNGQKNHTLVIIGALFVLAALCVCFASHSTSPLYRYFLGWDSAQFQTIGKMWSLGKIPYVDAFDHKGPFIFWVNMLGYLLTGNYIGVAVFQVLFLTVSLAIILKISQMASRRVLYGIISLAVFLCSLTVLYGEGNLTEEYCLTFLAACTYFFVKYFLSETVWEHDAKQAVFYGLSFGVCLLTRITNAVYLCVGVAVIACSLIRKKLLKNLIQNILGFFCGFLLIVIPFSIYFAANGAVGDFLYGTIGFNIEYISGKSSWCHNASVKTWCSFAFFYFPVYSIFPTALLSALRKKYSMSVYCVLCGISEMFLFLGGSLYSHYALICLPQLTLLLNEIIQIKSIRKILIKWKQVLILGIALYTAVGFTYFTYTSAENFAKWRNPQEYGYESLLDLIPDKDKDSFVAYLGGKYRDIYLLHGLMPCYKYFVQQEAHSKWSRQVKEDIHDTFQSGNAKWILTGDGVTAIQDVLFQRYQLAARTGRFSLYRLME